MRQRSATGAHRSVHARFPPFPSPFGQTVMFSEVEATRMAAKTFTVPG